MEKTQSQITWDALTIQKYIDPEKTPTPEQIAVIEGPLRPTLVVAGAGSGKTETMSMRVLWLVAHEEMNPERILGLTFSRKAAGELGERLRERLAALAQFKEDIAHYGDPTVTTYNSFAQRIVLEHGWRVGFSSDIRLLNAGSSIQMMNDIVREHPIDELPSGSLDTIVQNCKNLAQRLSEHGYTVGTARQALKELVIDTESQAVDNKGKLYADGVKIIDALDKRETYLALVEKFMTRKKELGVIDFSDQLSIATRLVKEFPDVRDAVRTEYDAVLLDEFQDTSVIQMELFSTIFGTIGDSALALTAVGDPQQAIYGWRGASAASLENFIRDFDCINQHLNAEELAEKSRAQTLSLSTAWRNDRQILAAANAIASPLQKRTHNMDIQPLRAREQAKSGRVVMNYFLTPEQEATFIADEYAQIITQWEKDCQKACLEHKELPARPSMAVLMSKRKYFSTMEDALRSRGLPVQIFGSLNLLDNPLVARLRMALTACSDLADGAALIPLLDSLRLGASDMALLWQWAAFQAKKTESARTGDVILLEAIDTPPMPGWKADPQGPAFTQEAYERVNVLGHHLRSIRHHEHRGLVELVEFAIDELGLIEDSLADPALAESQAALDTFMDVVTEYADGNEWADIHGFLTWLAIAETENSALPSPPQMAQDGAVHLMTVHASKGLEWDVVSVVALGDGAFPDHGSTSKMRDLIDKGTHFEQDPQSMWSTSGWLTAIEELPYNLRGDKDALPIFDFDEAQDWVRDNGKAWSFAQYVKDHYKTKLACHLEAEQRRLAYVALTRARHTLFLTGRWYDGGTKPRYPSAYWLEALRTLIRQGEDETTRSNAESWTVYVSDKERQEMLTQWREAEQKIKDPKGAFQLAQERLSEDEKIYFYPQPSTPFQQRCEEAGANVLNEAENMVADADVLDMLEGLSDDDMIRRAIAVIAHKRRSEENTIFPMELSEVRATAVASLIEDAQAFALNLRRPIPKQPSASASLGTLIHAWVERQLRQVTAELWTEEIEGVELLSEKEKTRFEAMQENFLTWSAPGKVKAIEELFAVRVSGMNIQGRIDAVFTDSDGDIVVDWKSGRMPRATDTAKLMYFRDQLRLYQLAWAQKQGVDPSEVRAQLFFLEHGQVITIEQIEHWLKDAGIHTDLEKQLELVLTDGD